LRHPNLQGLLGATDDRDNPDTLYLVLPRFEPSRGLRAQLDRGAMGWADRLKIARQISGALCHLQALRPPVFFAHLSSSSVFLTPALDAVLTDFWNGGDLHMWAGSPEFPHHQHLCPEYRRSRVPCAEAVLFPLGVILDELLGGEQEQGFRVGDTTGQQRSQLRLLAMQCRQDVPRDRPSWSVVDRRLLDLHFGVE